MTAREKIYNFIAKHPLTVISTIDLFHKAPEAALIAFTQNEQLQLYFMTFSDSRKYANLQQNQSVSFVIGFDYTTIQYDGVAHELEGDASREALQAFCNKETPCTPDFLNDQRARFFKVSPKWIRYSDYTVCPADILEMEAFHNSYEIS